MRHPWPAITTVVTITAVVAILVPAVAFAQAGLPGPFVDVGVDGTATLSPAVSGQAVTPRVTLNFTPELALAIRADATALKDRIGSYSSRARLFSLELHQQMAHRGPLAVQGIAGFGLRTQRDDRPAYGVTSAPGSLIVGQIGDHVDHVRLVGLMGIGVAERVGRALEFRQDFRLSADSSGLDAGVSAGITIPLGRYATRAPGQSTIIGVRRVHSGQRVWITQRDGVVVEGQIGDLTPSSIEIVGRDGRWAIDKDDVRTVEIPDGLRDGIVKGVAIGGAGLGAYGAFIASSLCECDDDSTTVLVTMMIAGMGAGGGALVGALADSLHVGRRTILDRSATATIVITPVATRSRAGVAATFRW